MVKQNLIHSEGRAEQSCLFGKGAWKVDRLSSGCAPLRRSGANPFGRALPRRPGRRRLRFLQRRSSQAPPILPGSHQNQSQRTRPGIGSAQGLGGRSPGPPVLPRGSRAWSTTPVRLITDSSGVLGGPKPPRSKAAPCGPDYADFAPGPVSGKSQGASPELPHRRRVQHSAAVPSDSMGKGSGVPTQPLSRIVANNG